MIDEAGIWSRALSSAEISQLYNGGAGLPYPLPPTYRPRSSPARSSPASMTAQIGSTPTRPRPIPGRCTTRPAPATSSAPATTAANMTRAPARPPRPTNGTCRKSATPTTTTSSTPTPETTTNSTPARSSTPATAVTDGPATVQLRDVHAPRPAHQLRARLQGHDQLPPLGNRRLVQQPARAQISPRLWRRQQRRPLAVNEPPRARL